MKLCSPQKLELCGSLANEKTPSSANASGAVSSFLASNTQRAQSREGTWKVIWVIYFSSSLPGLLKNRHAGFWFHYSISKGLHASSSGGFLMKPKDFFIHRTCLWQWGRRGAGPNTAKLYPPIYCSGMKGAIVKLRWNRKLSFRTPSINIWSVIKFTFTS